MDWFRMYHEFASDAKVQSMSEAMQRRLMMLFCLRCSNALETLQHDELAFALRISEDELEETKALFLRKSFIDEDWQVLQWDKRQFVSDNSSPRVKRHRDKKKAEDEKRAAAAAKRALKQDGNVTLTPQNRTEQIQNRADTENTGSPEPQSDSTPAAESPQLELVSLEDLPPLFDVDASEAAAPPVPPPAPVIMMPLVGDAEFGIMQAHIDEWTGAYPAVDVIRQLAAMRQWCLANPVKRKTKRGVLSFCNAWLVREQDRPSRPVAASGGTGGAWWSSDATVIAKGAEMALRPTPGERMPDFKARVQAAIDNGGVAPAPQRMSLVGVAPAPMAPKSLMSDAVRAQLKELTGRAAPAPKEVA